MDDKLVIVSNRGPAQFERVDGERVVQRGGGGLVTALTGLVAHRGALWVASTMTEEDAVVAREAGDEPIAVELDGVSYEVCLVESDPAAYDRFYNVIANPILWFIQHYLWDLSNAPDIRQEESDAWDVGYEAINRDIAEAVVERIEGRDEPLVMFHDYHLYTCPGLVREARPTPSCSTSSTSRGRSPTAGGSCRGGCASRSTAACSPTTSSASTPPPTAATSSTAAGS